MPKIGTVNPAEVELLPEKRELLREPYNDMIRALQADKQPRQLEPDEGESLRKLKVNVTRAANDLGVDVVSRETRDGKLVVYLKPEKITAAQRKANRKAEAAAAQETESVEAVS